MGFLSNSIIFVLLLCVLHQVINAAPVAQGETREEFVFILPGSDGTSKLYRFATPDEEKSRDLKIPFSLDLEPPLLDNRDIPANPALTLKDSYGNPVPPSVYNSESSQDFGIPFIGNSGEPSASNGPKTVVSDGVKFTIPSYASGITDIRKPTDELLPPLQGDDVPKAPPNTPIETPSIEALLPPFPGNPPKDESLNEIPDTIPFNSPIPSAPIAPVTQAPTAPPTTQANIGSKYTGGFGGAPGILGEQKQIGYAIKDKQNVQTTTPGKALREKFGVDGNLPANVNSLGQPDVKPANDNSKYTGGFGGAPGVLGQQQPGVQVTNKPAVPAQAPTPAPTFASAPQTGSGKYTGGFGGPPGILVPYDNKKTERR